MENRYRRSLNSFRLTFLLIVLVAIRLSAQDNKQPMPKQPLLPRAPNMSAWAITYRYKADADTDQVDKTNKVSHAVDHVTSIQIEKTGTIYHEVAIYSTSGRTESWIVDGKEFIKDRAAPEYVLMPTDTPRYEDYSKSDFEDLDWLNMKYYVGFKKGEQPVFIFQAKNSDRPPTRRDSYRMSIFSLKPISPFKDGLNQPSSDQKGSDDMSALQASQDKFRNAQATVVLDAVTQLPVGYDDGRTTWSCQFTTPPAEMLIPPLGVAVALKRWDSYLQATTIHPSSP